MTTATKVWLIIAASLCLLGIIIFGGIIAMANFDLSMLSTSKYTTNEHIITDSFSDIDISSNTADIDLIPSDDGKCRIVCYEEENARHAVSVNNGVLSVKVVNEKKWYQYIGIYSGTPKVSVYLPEDEYGALTISGSTGSIDIPDNFSFGDVSVTLSTGRIGYYADSKDLTLTATTGDITAGGIACKDTSLSVSTGSITASDIECTSLFTKVTTGKTNISDVKCESFISKGNTGDIVLERLVSTGDIAIDRSTGDVKLSDCDGSEIKITTDTGDVSGSLLSEKVFITSSDTGDINVPKTTTGGKCEITTDTGDIEIEIN